MCLNEKNNTVLSLALIITSVIIFIVTGHNICRMHLCELYGQGQKATICGDQMRKNKYRHKLEDSAVFPSHLFGSRQSPCQLEVSGRQISPNYIETLQIFFFLLLYSTFLSFPFLFLDKVLLIKICGGFFFME